MGSDIFPNNWKLCPLEDVMDAIIDYRGKTPKKTEAGIPLVTAKIVKGGYVQTPSEFIAEDNYESWMVRGLPEVGDVVLTTEAPLGETAQLTDSNVALAQRIVTLRGKHGVLNNDFLLCAMQSSFVQHQLESRATGSTVKGIKQSELRKILLPIPPLEEQQRISNILKTVSDKILLNTKTNQTLEQIAQALFKSWFVDFDPVKAKIAVLEAGGTAEEAELAAMEVIAAKSTEQLAELKQSKPDAYEQLAQTAALFPSAMQESELGDIPEGWEITSLKALSDKISKGTTPSKQDLATAEDEASIKFIKVKDIDEQSEIIRNSLEMIPNSIHIGKLKRSVLETNDILFSIAGTIGRVATVDNDLNNVNTNQAVAFIRLKDKENFLPLVYMSLRESRLQSKALASIVQGVQANLSLANVGDMEVLVPSSEVLELWNKQYSAIFKKVKSNFAQSRQLSTLRDILLPELLSGGQEGM